MYRQVYERYFSMHVNNLIGKKNNQKFHVLFGLSNSIFRHTSVGHNQEISIERLEIDVLNDYPYYIIAVSVCVTKKCDLSIIQLQIIGENKMISLTAVDNHLYSYGKSNQALTPLQKRSGGVILHEIACLLQRKFGEI